MVNIWEYAYADNIRVVCTTGETFEGNVIDIVDSDEDEDMTEDEAREFIDYNATFYIEGGPIILYRLEE